MTARSHLHDGSRLDIAADRLLNLDSPVYGDERERRIVLEASSLGHVAVSFVGLAAAVLAAAAGAVGASVVLVLVASVPSFTALWYSKRHGVDTAALALRDRRLYAQTMGATFLLLALWCAAVAVYGFTGHPLVPVPDVASWFRDTDALRGAAVGGAFGGVAGAVWVFLSGRRAARRDVTDEPDDEF